LFVAVISPVGNFNLRKALRKWQWLMSTFPSVGHASYMFFVGKGTDAAMDRTVAQEMEQFGDVVQLSLLDTYMNLAVKSVAAAAWFELCLDAAKFRFWLKVEDYMSIDLREINRLVEKLDDHKSHTERQAYYGGGKILSGMRVHRNGRWGCPRRHCDYDTYPTKYASGQYLLDREAVHILTAKGLPRLDVRDPYPIEDHYVASILLAAGIEASEDRTLRFLRKPYGAPSVVAGNFLLCLDTEREPLPDEHEEGAWEGAVLFLPSDVSISKAWYGDPDSRFRWGSKRGKHVLNSVLQRVRNGLGIKIGNQEFGDPAPSTRKVLLLKVKHEA